MEEDGCAHREPLGSRTGVLLFQMAVSTSAPSFRELHRSCTYNARLCPSIRIRVSACICWRMPVLGRQNSRGPDRLRPRRNGIDAMAAGPWRLAVTAGERNRGAGQLADARWT